MKYVFLINPAAGKCDQTKRYTEIIDRMCGARKLEYAVAVSRQAGDLTAFARAEAETGQPVRLYACGGDGTLNEVVNGAVGFDNAAVTHFPGGSGNDFIRIFSDPSAFSDLERLLDGEETQFDLIQCQDSYAINVCSMGLDARIGTDIARYKRLPLVSGSGAYILSTLVNVLRGIHQPCRLEIGDEVIDGEQTMVFIANGRWYGGGFHPVPEAEPDDGMLEVLIVKAVSRLKVAQVIGQYKAGGYRRFPDIILHRRCRALTVHCEKDSVINLDGELRRGRDVTIRVAKEKIRFFFPRGLQWHARDERILQESAAY